MKKLITILFLSLFSSINTFACEEVHNIILIHGIASNKNGAGFLKDALEGDYYSCTKVHQFEYDTGNDQKTIFNFADDLDSFITKLKLKSTDKISFIMHSQGGLVGQAYLIKIKDSEKFDQIDSFITLGTPYHGAMIAKAGFNLLFLKGLLNKSKVSPFGKRELQGMSYGSATLRILKKYNYLLSKVKSLAIGGYTPSLGGKINESDLIVPLYSSNPNSIYVTTEGEQQITNTIPFVNIDAQHIDLLGMGIGYIPRKCKNSLRNCNHPSARLISEHLEGNTAESFSSDIDKNYFRINLYIKSKVRPFVVVSDNSDIKGSISSSLMNASKRIYRHLYSKTVFGKIDRNDSTVSIRVVNLRGEYKHIKVPVNAGLTTYVDLNMSSPN